MSSFICEHCGALILDTPQGYVTECEHYPMEALPIPRFLMDRQLELPLQAVLSSYLHSFTDM